MLLRTQQMLERRMQDEKRQDQKWTAPADAEMKEIRKVIHGACVSFNAFTDLVVLLL
jgi:hypothetical protein